MNKKHFWINSFSSVQSVEKPEKQIIILLLKNSVIYHTIFSGHEKWYGACLDIDT